MYMLAPAGQTAVPNLLKLFKIGFWIFEFPRDTLSTLAKAMITNQERVNGWSNYEYTCSNAGHFNYIVHSKSLGLYLYIYMFAIAGQWLDQIGWNVQCVKYLLTQIWI